MKRLKPGQVSLERALSKLGIASRTQARAMIEAGRVRVNGVLREHPGFAVNPDRARIEIDGGSPVERAAPLTLALHKTRGTVTTRSDEKGRPTVFSLLSKSGGEFPHLSAVGRLDQATTGLLILTNDTQLAAWLTDPKNGVVRTYLVSVRGEVTPEKLKTLSRGVLEKGEWLKPDDVVLRKASGKESHLVVKLSEGKNREIRRMFASLGHEVTQLKRVAYGGFELGTLKPGEYIELSQEQLRELFPGAPIRPPLDGI